ncbi:MAG: zinc-ribbon domain-containing protein [Rhizobiales bacterium]|nr:zinc-ribbon domain-containing protein [Rhizobacter sp.]
MSLATRCTACGTVFRVVQDQLKVSEGWVRCGRCNEVFNALEGLFDLERDTPPDSPAGTPAFAEATVDPTPSPPAALPVPKSTDESESADALDKIDAQLTRPRESAHDSTPATRVRERDRLEFPDAQFDPDMLADDTAELDAAATEPLITRSPAPEELGEADAPAAPEFVQHAQRKAHWQSPGMRALQAGGITALLAVLGLQAAHQFRDQVAAQWPETAPTLAAWCGAVGCTIAAPRRIDDIAVESTALTRAPIADAFQLSVVLRNRGSVTVGLPSVDLSLTDENGQLVSRRMLVPRDFRAPSSVLGPGAESALQLLLSTGGTRVTGYTVEVFYP